ncbi:MAG: hypothetical protein ACTHMT_12210, partial [Verrucomicrobiota bacterium]
MIMDPDQETLFETIIFDYDYTSGDETNHFTITAVLPPKGQSNLTLSDADKVLADWGLSRTK